MYIYIYDSPDSHTDSSLFARECWLFQHICFISQRLVGHGKRSFRHVLGVVQKLFEEEKGDTTKGCVFAASCLVIPSPGKGGGGEGGGTAL